MSHLIVCCDGTWNTSEQGSVTNVRRLYNALGETAQDGNDQLPYYQPGVGTAGGLLSRLRGGAFGTGLSGDVMDVYHWLTTRYESSDRIWLFGFSRGAYTVRSLAGMIKTCGLLDTSDLDETETWRQIEHVYDSKYRADPDGADRDWREKLKFTFDPDCADKIPVYFIGVWDTVGSLGVPDYLGPLKLLDSPSKYAFHNVNLNPEIRHARHAVAMDEPRGPFAPTLWKKIRPEQDVKQVWFPGSHMDVGGGHLQTGLSDGALQWMIDETAAIQEAGVAVGLTFHHRPVRQQMDPDPFDRLHDDNRGVLGLLEFLSDDLLEPFLEYFLQPRPRAVPQINPNAQSPLLDQLHKSVYQRNSEPSITGGRYRPTRVPAVNQPETVDVFAREPWNETGLYLEPGDYTFAAQGEWRNGEIWSSPDGALSRFRPVEGGLVHTVSTLIDQVEKLFQRGTRDVVASILSARREKDLPWMSLVGVVANDAEAVEGKPNQHKHEHIAIGTSAKRSVTKGGYFYAFANDGWGFYGNNQGSVRLTVTKTK